MSTRYKVPTIAKGGKPAPVKRARKPSTGPANPVVRDLAAASALATRYWGANLRPLPLAHLTEIMAGLHRAGVRIDGPCISGHALLRRVLAEAERRTRENDTSAEPPKPRPSAYSAHLQAVDRDRKPTKYSFYA